MDKAGILATVVRHYIMRKQPPACHEGICYYRYGDARCPVGLLIPDHIYHPSMESQTVREIVRGNRAVRAHLDVQTNNDLRFLESLQLAHDDAANASSYSTESFAEYFRYYLAHVALDFRLPLHVE